MTTNIIIQPARSADQFLAYCPGWVGCSATGSTREAAMVALMSRLRERFRSLKRDFCFSDLEIIQL